MFEPPSTLRKEAGRMNEDRIVFTKTSLIFTSLAAAILLVAAQPAWAQIDTGCTEGTVCPSDSIPCTTEPCNTTTHRCESVPTSPAPDGCGGGTGCTEGTVCPSDNNPCTTERCNTTTHRCESVPTSPAPDGCGGGTGCTEGTVCPSDNNPCTKERCNTTTH